MNQLYCPNQMLLDNLFLFHVGGEVHVDKTPVKITIAKHETEYKNVKLLCHMV